MRPAHVSKDESEIKTDLLSYCKKLQTAVDNVYSTPRKVNFITGRKYWKVILVDERFPKGGEAHCFVDRLTGLIYKPASWKAPTLNFARGSVCEIENRCFEDEVYGL